MKSTTSTRSPRMSADERRQDILHAAVAAFAVGGLHGTSTEDIARRAGVSQPYLFRLFGTKKDLFLASVEYAFDRVLEDFRLAAEKDPEQPLHAMGEAYRVMLPQRELLLLQMHAYAACSDDDVRDLVRRRYGELYRFAESVSGAPPDQVSEFFARGMLLNVSAAMDLPAIVPLEAWAARCMTLPD